MYAHPRPRTIPASLPTPPSPLPSPLSRPLRALQTPTPAPAPVQLSAHAEALLRRYSGFLFSTEEAELLGRWILAPVAG